MFRLNKEIWPAVFLWGGIGLYLLTLVEGVQPADSGEFQWVGATLGLAHPPGFPLYTLLAYWTTRLLDFSPAFTISALSVVFAGLTLTVVFQATVELGRSLDQRAAIAGGAVAALTLATSTTFWAQATTANIRSLTILLAALAYYALIRLANTSPTSPWKSWQNPLIGFALAIGLGVTHHLSLAFIGLIMCGFALWFTGERLKRPDLWVALLGTAIASALPWLYLPWRSSELRSWGPFWEYALGLGFRGDFFYFRTFSLLWDRLGVMGNIFLFQFSPVSLFAGAIGAILLLRRRPRLGWLFLVTFVVHTVITALYRAPQAVEYLLPAYLPIVVAAGFGSAVLANRVTQRAASTAAKATGDSLPLIFIMIALWQGVTLWPSFRFLANSQSTQDYVNNALDHALGGGDVLADWHWYTPLRYAQEVEEKRTDVHVDFVFPQTASYGEDWARAIDQSLTNGNSPLVTHIDPDAYQQLPTPFPVGEAVVFSPAPPSVSLKTFRSAPPTLQGITIRGWDKTVTPAGEIAVTVGWTVEPIPVETWRTFAQLRDQAGRPVALDDQPLPIGQGKFLLSRFRLFPQAGSPPGEYQLIVGVYDGARSDAAPAESALGTISLGGSVWAPATQNRVRWPQPAVERILIGYDWDHTLPDQARLYLHWRLDSGRYWSETVDLPPGTPFTLTGVRRWIGPLQTVTLEPDFGGRYVPFSHGIVWLGNTTPLAGQLVAPGETMMTRQLFAADRPIERDIGFAVRLIGLEEDHVTWAWLSPEADADIPALGGIPTLKWVAGTRVYHPRRLTISAGAAAGQWVEGFLRPYEVMTNRPLGILDDRFAESGRQWVPFDQATIRGLDD